MVKTTLTLTLSLRRGELKIYQIAALPSPPFFIDLFVMIRLVATIFFARVSMKKAVVKSFLHHINSPFLVT